MTRVRGINVYSTAVMMFGVYTLLGSGSYGNFSSMFKGLNGAVVMVIYSFTVFYGICGIYCGSKMLKLEDWARKMVIAVTSTSVLMSFAINRTVFENFKVFLASGKAGVAAEQAVPVYRYAVILAALVTLFEISVVFYLTRPSVRKNFR